MYKSIIILFFFNITSLYASELISKNLQKTSALINKESQESAISRLEKELNRLNSENIELKNNVSCLNNYVLALMKAQSDLLTLIQNNFNQQSNQNATSAAQNLPTKTIHTHSSLSSITTKKQPLIRRSSFTSTSTNQQQNYY